MPLYWFILYPFITALLAYIFPKKLSKKIILMLQCIFVLFALYNFIQVRNNGIIISVLGGYNEHIGISLRADSLGSVMVLLTVFLFTCMLIYNYHKSYMNHLFLFLFLVLQGLVNGLFLSNDLFNIYVIVEVSTIVVTILIVFKKDSRSIYDGMIYLLTNLASMTFFLLGVGYMYKIFGTLNLSIIERNISMVTDIKTLIIPYVLLITAVSLKSAIMPLFSWLPKAHGTASAPSIISAILSGLYVKGGVYLLIRFVYLFDPIFGDKSIFLFFGFVTAVAGFILAISQTDIKLILAYHTVSQIGLIVFGLSIDNQYSYFGGVYHIINHAIFKSTLFLTAGIIIEEYHTRDIRKIRGVLKKMPCVAFASIIAILGITGAPLFNGAFSKYLIQKGAGHSLGFEIGFFIINLGTVMSFVKYSTIFKGTSNSKSHIPFNQKFVILTLATLCFLGGILGPVFMETLFRFKVNVSITSYSGKLLLYVINLALGLLFYIFLYNRIKVFKKIREVELSFNQIAVSLMVFFSGFLLYMMVQY